MNQSTEINELAMSLSKAQGEMQSAIKDKLNPFFKSMYADLGSVWDAARPVLSKNGLAVVQTTEMNNGEIIMVTTLIHSSGQWMKSYLPLILAKKDSQGIGAAITYLRRYSLSAIVGVVCDDDDDGETSVGRGKSEPSAKNNQKNCSKQETIVDINEKIGDSEFDEIHLLLGKLDSESNKSFFTMINKMFNVSSVNNIPKTAFKTCVNSLNAKIKLLKDQERVVA